MTSWRALERQVRKRALDRCEYCQMHQSLQGAAFHLEHIVPRSRGGSSTLENLAWACPGCNLHKSDRIEVPDPDDGEFVPLFHPRTDRWADHFTWVGYEIVAVSAIGRGTIAALEMNQDRRVRIRRAEEMFDLFPPQ